MIAGIDEAGRGALAGPVVSALVIFDTTIDKSQFKDSKTLTHQQRIKKYHLLKNSNSIIKFSIVNNKEIDKTNILKATLKSMKNCILKLKKENIKPESIIIDGNKKPDVNGYNISYCIKGDKLIPEISAASILAKVIRDKIMIKYSNYYKEHNFDKHKGYGTSLHYESIQKYGLTKLHRKTFNTSQQLKLFK
jgi:ribonuclease HII